MNESDAINQGLTPQDPSESKAQAGEETVEVSLSSLEAMKAENARLKAEKNKAEAASAAMSQKLKNNALFILQQGCVPYIIGGRGGALPGEDPDIVVQDEMCQGRLTQIAWVPIPIWPTAILSKRQPYWERQLKDFKTGDPIIGRDGKPEIERIPNYDLGQTQVRQSRAVAKLKHVNPETGEETIREVSLTCYATLSMNSKSPSEVAEAIDRMERTSKFQRTGNGASGSEASDGSGHQTDTGDGTFIPSEEANKPNIRFKLGPGGAERGRSDQ